MPTNQVYQPLGQFFSRDCIESWSTFRGKCAHYFQWEVGLASVDLTISCYLLISKEPDWNLKMVGG